MIRPLLPRLPFETPKLGVAYGLKSEAGQPDEEADGVQGPQGSFMRPVDEDDGIGDEQEEKALEHENLDEAPRDKSLAPFLPPSGVSEVFAAPLVADEDVGRQPDAPNHDKPAGQELAGRSARFQEERHGPDQDEPDAPTDIDGGVVLFDKGQEE